MVKMIGYIEKIVADDDPMRVTSSTLGSVQLRALGEGAVQRLKEWEAAAYRKDARNGAGARIGKLRMLMNAERAAPTNPIFKGEKAEDIFKQQVLVQLKAMALELRKMCAHGIGGSLREECRTEEQKRILDRVSHNSMLSERTLASMKQVSKIMATGSHAGKAARVNARMSRFWGDYDDMSAEEQGVLDSLMQRFLRKLKEFDRSSRQLADAETAARAQRHWQKQMEELAREHANRLVLFKVELWEVKEVDRKLQVLVEEVVQGKGKAKARKTQRVWRDRNKWAGPESQARLLCEQMEAVVVGHSQADLACPKGECSDDCKCGAKRGDCYLDHLKMHVKYALKEIRRRWQDKRLFPEGKPTKPALPTFTLGNRPPTLNDDQGSNPIDEQERELERRAVQLVDDGKVKAEIALFADMTIPEINDALVGEDIAYRGMWHFPGRKNRMAYTYDATILSVNLHPMPGEKQLPSVVVRWHIEGQENVQPVVFLDLDMYHEMDQVGGWSVYRDGNYSDPVSASDAAMKEQGQSKMEAEYLLCDSVF
jgi:hypothetical protein